MSCGTKGTEAYKNCMYKKSLKEKHIVKSKTTTTSTRMKTKRTSKREVTNIESSSNRRTQTTSYNTSSNPKGGVSRLTTRRSPSGNGRQVLSNDGSWNEFGAKKSQKEVRRFQRTANKGRKA
jgi:hypothetical protein|tara:strand:+ start:153 stop:518 length:366 start_codon:yes stop_codon:yes gene_type:complete